MIRAYHEHTRYIIISIHLLQNLKKDTENSEDPVFKNRFGGDDIDRRNKARRRQNHKWGSLPINVSPLMKVQDANGPRGRRCSIKNALSMKVHDRRKSRPPSKTSSYPIPKSCCHKVLIKVIIPNFQWNDSFQQNVSSNFHSFCKGVQTNSTWLKLQVNLSL